MLSGLPESRASSTVGDAMKHGRSASVVEKLLATNMMYKLLDLAGKELSEIKSINGVDASSLSVKAVKGPDPFADKPALKQKFAEERDRAYRINLHMFTNEKEITKKNTMLKEEDIERINTELWSWVLANYESDPSLASVHEAGQQQLLAVVKQKVTNWFTQSGKGGFQAMLKARKETVRNETAGEDGMTL